MKKMVSILAVVFLSNALFAQGLDDVKKLVDKGDYAAAKVAVDNYLANEKNAAKADGWYFKGVIYNEVSKKEELKATCINCKMDAFSAFKKYQAMDAKNTYMLLEQNVRLFDLYNGFFDAGSKMYGAQNYVKAFENFRDAGVVEDYIYSKGFEYNGFKFGSFDTALILNTALAARASKMDDKAVFYYQKLLNINLHRPEDLEMYQYLAAYYSTSKNKTALDALLAKAKNYYPNDSYWIEVELDQVDNKDKRALFAKFEEILPKNPGNYNLAYNYAVELFNFTYVGDNRPEDYDALKTKLTKALENVLALKSNASANLLMARHIYNSTYDVQDLMLKVKGSKPDEIKKRAEFKSSMMQMADQCIKYTDLAILEFAKMTGLKVREKADYKNAYSIQESMYSIKGNVAKAAEAKKKGDAL